MTVSVSVYIIGEAGTEAPVKIGFAADTKRRLCFLQGGNHRRLEVRAARECADENQARLVEARLHQLFAEHRMVGEWFAVDATAAASAMLDVSVAPEQIRPPSHPEILAEIDRHIGLTGISATAFGIKVAKDSCLVADLRKGRELRWDLRQRIAAEIAASTSEAA